MKKNGKYNVNSDYNCIDAYKPIDHELEKYPSFEHMKPENWKECSHCGLKPKVWTSDNGRSTACGCWNSPFDHFSIHAESICSYHKNDGNTANYKLDDLMKKWNHWCETGEVLFEHAGQRTDGRW